MAVPTVHIERQETDPARFRAVTENGVSFGRTPGEALDGLKAQGDGQGGSLVVIQPMQPDAYFSEAQYQRMRSLLDRRPALTADEEQELRALVEEELLASAKRTQALADALGR